MLYAVTVRPDKQNQVPAITHVDGTARPQTVSRVNNPLYYDLIENYCRLTGQPLLVNTSFNIKDMPIVCSPKDAIQCFLLTNIDILVLGPYYISKKRQKP
jgi:carbamoyltransferase